MTHQGQVTRSSITQLDGGVVLGMRSYGSFSSLLIISYRHQCYHSDAADYQIVRTKVDNQTQF